MQPSDRVTVGYIGGTSYCGSTLLSFLLNAQSAISSIGEVAWSIPSMNPGQFPCSCGVTLAACPFWERITGAMKQRGYAFSADQWDMTFDIAASRVTRKLAVRSLGDNLLEDLRDDFVRLVPRWGDHLREVGERNLALIGSIAATTGTSVFVDASKDPTRVRFLRKYCAIEPYVIHLVRDSPAFVNSYIKKRTDSLSFERAIDWWNATARRMERLRTATPADHWLLVRYEELCADPAAQIGRILTYLGVAHDAVNLDFRFAANHIIGNAMRLSNSSEIRLDTSWRDELPSDRLKEVVNRTTEYRQLFGYAAGSSGGRRLQGEGA